MAESYCAGDRPMATTKTGTIGYGASFGYSFIKEPLTLDFDE